MFLNIRPTNWDTATRPTRSDKELGAEVERLEQLDHYSKQSYMEIVEYGSKLASLANSHTELTVETGFLQPCDISCGENIDQLIETEYNIEQLLEDTREKTKEFSDYAELIEEKRASIKGLNYNSFEKAKAEEISARLKNRQQDYRDVICLIETIDHELTGSDNKNYDRPSIGFQPFIT